MLHGDGLGNASDPCTNVVPVFGVVGKTKLTLIKLLAPTGDDRLRLTGRFTNLPTTPAIDALGKGVRLLLNDATGAVVLDVTIPGGAYDTGTQVGWLANKARTVFRYRDKCATPIQGIIKVSLRSKPGLFTFSAVGRNGSYPVATGALPLTMTLVLDAPVAQSGQCGEMHYPACTVGTGGSTVKCK